VADHTKILFEVSEEQMEELALYCEAIASLSRAEKPQAALASLYQRFWLKLREIRGEDKE
jgi:hypothetical protein